ncbi:MAG: carbon-phosphorus lyase complex subunit PhnI [Methanosarcinaceae archaeon]
MGYVLVKGGGEAIKNAESLVGWLRSRGANTITIAQVKDRMRLAVDQVMGEGGLYAPDIAALAIRQADGDLIEASFLVRAYRSTLPRIGYSENQDTRDMFVLRRISSAFKDIPGGQILGPTIDYTQRLIDFKEIDESGGGNMGGEGEGEVKGEIYGEGEVEGEIYGEGEVKGEIYREGEVKGEIYREGEVDKEVEEEADVKSKGSVPWGSKIPEFSKVADLLREDGMLEDASAGFNDEPFDITRESMRFPAPRSARLQALARGETGAMLSFAYSSLRGYGSVHPTIAELRIGYVPVRIKHPYTGNAVSIGDVQVTECEGILSGVGTTRITGENKFSLGYGLVFGHNEKKAISMSILDGTLEVPEPKSPSEDQEFVLYHIDGIDAMGFVEHLKLPHYVTFQSSLDRIRAVQNEVEDD